jgi:GNAT superfamily N-acetyltransferase
MRIIKLDESFFYIFIDNHYEEWIDDYKNKSISYNDLVNYYRKNSYKIYIAITDDNEYIGCYSVCNKTNSISDVLVVKKYRNMGYGKILLRDAIKKLNNRTYITLYCNDDKLVFYEKFGFFCISKTVNGDNLMIKLNYNIIFIMIMIILLAICFFYV